MTSQSKVTDHYTLKFLHAIIHQSFINAEKPRLVVNWGKTRRKRIELEIKFIERKIKHFQEENYYLDMFETFYEIEAGKVKKALLQTYGRTMKRLLIRLNNLN